MHTQGLGDAPEEMPATPIEEVWTQLLRASDIHTAISRQKADANDADAAQSRLAWAPDGWWPLSEAQLRLLSFEALLLCQPPPAEKEATTASSGGEQVAGSGPATRSVETELVQMSEEQTRKLIDELSARLTTSVLGTELDEEEVRLPSRRATRILLAAAALCCLMMEPARPRTASLPASRGYLPLASFPWLLASTSNVLLATVALATHHAPLLGCRRVCPAS